MKSCEKQSKRKKIEFRDFIIQMNLLKSPKVDQLPNLKVTCIKSAFRVLCDIFATLKPQKPILMYVRTKEVFKTSLCMLLIIIYTLCQSL